jgi:hypothetical protein
MIFQKHNNKYKSMQESYIMYILKNDQGLFQGLQTRINKHVSEPKQWTISLKRLKDIFYMFKEYLSQKG